MKSKPTTSRTPNKKNDIIRYIEKIPNSCIDDLKIPDSRILRPRTLIIHDNLKKKIYFIIIMILLKSSITHFFFKFLY